MPVEVRYLVSDVPQAVAFYTTHFGFEVVQDFGEPFAMLERDGLRLWVSGPASSAARAMPDGRRPEPGGWNRFVLTVDDIGRVVDGLRAAGVSTRSDVVRGPGGAQCVVDDPDGNPVELFQPAG